MSGFSDMVEYHKRISKALEPIKKLNAKRVGEKRKEKKAIRAARLNALSDFKSKVLKSPPPASDQLDLFGGVIRE